MDSLGTMIKSLREQNDLPLRKVAAFLDIDQSILSKFESGRRHLKREHVEQLAEYFKSDRKQMLVQWLAEKILSELNDEEIALEALQLAEERLKLRSEKIIKSKTGTNNYLKLSEAITKESLQWGGKLPTFMELAKTLFISLTGEKFNERLVNPISGYIGENKTHEVYLFYKPNEEWLKHNALTLNKIQELPKFAGKKRLICASLKYVNDETLKLHHVEFCKLPY
jgi:HTH-type transcriptional regulator, competence development regulator